MPVLTNIKHETFGQNYVRGARNGLNARQAYLAAGFECSPESADAAASRLLKSIKVRQRVAELVAPAAVKRSVDVSAKALIDKSESLIERGLATDQLTAVGKGIELQGKLGGALIDRVEMGGVGAFGQLQSLDDVARYTIESHSSVDEALTQLDALREAIVRIASDEAKLVAPH